MTSGLLLSDKISRQFEVDNQLKIVTNLSRFNIFIGVNNSGKSRLIREIYSNSTDFQYLPAKFSASFKNAFLASIYKIEEYLNSNRRFEIQFKDENWLCEGRIFFSSQNSNELNTVAEFIIRINNITLSDFTYPKKSEPTLKNLLNQILVVGNQMTQLLHSHSYKRKTKGIYIPVLRGLRPIQISGQRFSNTDVYYKRSEQDYFKHNDQISNTIYTGLSMYEDVMKLLLGSESDRETIARFERFLEENIFKQKVNLIPKYQDDVLHIKLGDDSQFEIFNLGDGLQTIITILFPLFLSRNDERLVFIEEPETHLHPAWQLLLLRALKKFEKYQYFISTHSTSFINDEESSIFVIRKRKKISICYSKVESDKVQIIKELGYKPSDLFQTNYIIWVEGPSDKMYLSYWISRTDNSLREGIHYSIMFYGGNTYRHFLEHGGKFNLDFLKNINQNFGIILDSDRTNDHAKYDVKKKEIKDLFESKYSFCWLTKLRTIENYINIDDFKKAVTKVHKKENIEICSDPYCDRSKVIDLNNKQGISPHVKIPQEMFSLIQKSNGSTSGITEKNLREGIEAALKVNSKDTFNIDKVAVAREVINLNSPIENQELQKEISNLVNHIKKANDL